MNESKKIRSVNVVENDEGYSINVLDVTKNPNLSTPRKILFEESDGIIKLFYIRKSGKVLDFIKFPDSLSITKRDKAGNVIRVIFDKYKNFHNSPLSFDMIDDFIEGFRNYLSLKKNKLTTSAEGDIEMVLDLLDLPLSIKKIERKDGLKWDADVDDGSFIEIEKRSVNDLFSYFKFYSPDDKYVPCININNKKNCTFFSIKDGESNISLEEPGGISNIFKGTPYHKYLIKKSLKREKEDHKEDFIRYFKDTVKSNPHPEGELVDSLNRMKKVLSLFLSGKEIEDICYPR